MSRTSPVASDAVSFLVPSKCRQRFSRLGVFDLCTWERPIVLQCGRSELKDEVAAFGPQRLCGSSDNLCSAHLFIQGTDLGSKFAVINTRCVHARAENRQGVKASLPQSTNAPVLRKPKWADEDSHRSSHDYLQDQFRMLKWHLLLLEGLPRGYRNRHTKDPPRAGPGPGPRGEH
jgi:hypothetical protein